MPFHMSTASPTRWLSYVVFLSLAFLLVDLVCFWTTRESSATNKQLQQLRAAPGSASENKPQRFQREHLLYIDSEGNGTRIGEGFSSGKKAGTAEHEAMMKAEKTKHGLGSYDSNSAEAAPLVSDAEANRNFQINFVNSYGMFDKWRRFKTHAFIVPSDSWNTLARRSVCLATQSSVDRMYWLTKTTAVWSGPVSVALFIPGIEFAIAKKFIEYLRNCFPNIRNQVSFHFTYPVDHHPEDSANVSEIVGQISCADPSEVLNKLLNLRPAGMMLWRESLEYPQNLLRNIARMGCQSQFIFTPDIDMIPVPKMDTDLEDFLSGPTQQQCAKCAYVVPVYEISKEAPHMPRNKHELLQLVKKKKARQFHIAVYAINQKSSNLSAWQALNSSASLQAAYSVKHYIFKYEPLYISKADVPLFDERFVGFGMTRNTQVYEMYVLGYQFMVLNNVFASHWGFQNLKTRPHWRARQQEANNAKFDSFAREISARYDRDPYNMLGKLKKMNLKNRKVVWNKSNSTGIK